MLLVSAARAHLSASAGGGTHLSAKDCRPFYFSILRGMALVVGVGSLTSGGRRQQVQHQAGDCSTTHTDAEGFVEDSVPTCLVFWSLVPLDVCVLQHQLLRVS